MSVKNKLPITLGIMAAMILQCAENPLAPETRGDNEVWIQNTQFVPQTLSVASGARVIWTNKDGDTHSVEHGTFMNPILDFFSGNLEEGDPFEHTFSKSGTFDYYCSIHQTGTVKQGQIIVN